MNADQEAEQALQAYEWLLRKGYFGVVDMLLDGMDPAGMSEQETLTILTITFHGKDRLRRRDAFLLKAEQSLAYRFGSARARKLLEARR